MDTLLGIPMSAVVTGVVSVFLVGVAGLLLTALRNRLLLALALRNIPRRRAQSALIALGLALGTVIITTALNTGDTMSYTIRSLVAGTIGRTDEIVVQPRRDARRTGFDSLQALANGTFLTGTLSFFDEAEYDRLALALFAEERIAGLAPAIIEQVVAVNTTTQELQNQVQLYGLPSDYPEVFGRLATRDGRAIALAEAPPGSVIINADAATALQAEAGHRLRVYVRERPIELTVAEVVNNGELGGVQATLLMPLRELQTLADQPRQINQILVANRGDGTTSVRLSEGVAGAIRPLLVDEAIAERLHRLLRSDVARAELTAALPNLDARVRRRMERLLRELDAEGPTAEFKSLISDPELERRVFGLGSRLSGLDARAGGGVPGNVSLLRVVEVKRLSQELADRWGGALTSLFVVLGLFSIATGIMLVVLIFVLLAAERRTEMGVTRALGAKRRHLIAMFLYEGLVYDLVASAVGLLVGLAVAAGLILASASVLRGYGIELRPHVEWRSLLLAYCLGAVLTMLSIGVSAYRASRLTVVAAINNLPDPPSTRPRLRGYLFGPGVLLLGLGAVWWGTATSWALPMGGGIALVVVGAIFAIRPFLSRLGLAPELRDRLAFSVGGLLLILYWLLPNELLRIGGIRPLPRSMDLFFLAGLTLMLGTIWLLIFNLDVVLATVRAGTRRLRGGAVIVTTALAYPTRYRFQTGMAVAMFGLVMFSMVVASVLLTGTHRAYSDPEAMSGGFQIRVEQTSIGAPTLPDLLDSAETVKLANFSALALQQGITAEAIQPGQGIQLWRSANVHLVDPVFLSSVRSGFTARATEYASDGAIWAALRDTPGLAVVAGPLVRARGAEPQQGVDQARGGGFSIRGVDNEDRSMPPLAVWVRDTRGGRAVKLTVIGVLDPRASFGTGLFTSMSTFAESGVPPPARTTYLAIVRPEASAAEKALGINLATSDRGYRATEIGEEVRRIQSLRMLLNQLLQGFIAVGLLAGIAGLGVISTRAVVERRQQIGIMRALGFTRRRVQTSFLLEASIVALLGISIGVALGLGLSYRIVQHLGREYPEILFSIPWEQILLLSTLAYGAAMLTTFLPAYQAGRINPAEALRSR